MKSSLSSPFRQRSFALVSVGCISMAAAFMAGCGSGGTVSSTPPAESTSVTVLASSTANDQLSGLTLDITGITLTNAAGKSVTLLTTPQYLEFIHLNGGVEPLTTVSVPQDVYTSATISATFGIPLCATYTASDPSGYGEAFSVDPAPVTDVTSNLPEPITVSGTGMGLELNLQVLKSTNYTSCAGIKSSSTPFSYTPTFTVTPVTLAAQPTNITDGMATGLRGLIGTVAAGGSSFSVAGDFGTGAGGPLWQVSSTGSTVFQGVTGASQLAAGMAVDMDVAIRADGTLQATRVAVYDTNPSNLSFSSGLQAYVSDSAPTMNPLAVEEQSLDFSYPQNGAIPYNISGATFHISGQLTNVSTLPFTASFNAANMVPGQNIFVTTHAANNNLPLQATTLTLLPQTINGTISAISSSGNFTTYTVTLAAYDLFPNLAGQSGQATLLTNPNSVVAYVDSNTLIYNTSPPAVGSVVRLNGLVFNDNGMLRMDCAQIGDGVAE